MQWGRGSSYISSPACSYISRPACPGQSSVLQLGHLRVLSPSAGRPARPAPQPSAPTNWCVCYQTQLQARAFLGNYYMGVPVGAFPCYKKSVLNLGLLAYQICRRVENSFPAERVIRRHAEQVWVCIARSGTGHIQVLIPEECTPCSICL